jgi:hypothetical protein
MFTEHHYVIGAGDAIVVYSCLNMTPKCQLLLRPKQFTSPPYSSGSLSVKRGSYNTYLSWCTLPGAGESQKKPVKHIITDKSKRRMLLFRVRTGAKKAKSTPGRARPSPVRDSTVQNTLWPHSRSRSTLGTTAPLSMLGDISAAISGRHEHTPPAPAAPKAGQEELANGPGPATYCLRPMGEEAWAGSPRSH